MTGALRGGVELMVMGRGGHDAATVDEGPPLTVDATPEAAVARWRALREALDRDATAAAAAATAAWSAVVDRILGDLDDPRLTDLEARIGVPGLLALREEHDDRIAAAQARRAMLVEMEEVARPSDVAGRIEAELVAARGRLAELAPEFTRWEASPSYRALVARGFFAEGYAPGWWRRRRDRRLAERLVREVGGADVATEPGAAVVAARQDLAARVDGGRALESRLLSRRARQAALERERAALTDAPSRLHAEMRRALVAAVREHLEAGSVELRYDLARDDAELASAFRRLAGLEAKARYLRQLAAARVERRLAAAEDAVACGGDGDGDVAAADAARAAAVDALRERLVAFEGWETGTVGGHILWWDRMTGGAPADDLPEVRGFRDTWGGPVADDHPAAALEAELRRPRARGSEAETSEDDEPVSDD